MAIFFTATLGFSIVGLVALFALKRWEIETGRVILPAARPSLSKVVREFWSWSLERAPSRARELARDGARHASREIHTLAALALLKLERTLENILRLVRHNTDAPQGGGAASGFLREVAEHKRRLQKRSLKNRSIFEE